MSAGPSTASILDARARIPGHVVYRAFAAETVALNLDSGKYHGLNPIGGRMLDALEKADSVRAAAASLSGEFGVPTEQVEQDIADFCSDLVERGLLELEAPQDRPDAA
jgi:hypothetical protein